MEEESSESDAEDYNNADEENEDEEIIKKNDMSIDNNPDRMDISKITNKAKKNPWMIISGILAVIIIVLLIVNFRGGISGNVISGEDAGAKVVDYVVSRGGSAELIGVQAENDLYKVTLSMQNGPVSVYVTKDGENIIPSLIPLTEEIAQPAQTQTTQVPKSDKPVVELFVMSFCPYGTQAEKGILPAVSLLGDKIDFKLRVVHYVLHGEKEDTENKRQLCIREEQGQDKLNKYLVCILSSEDVQNPADVTECEKEAGINSAKLNTCMKSNAENYFTADSELSEGYGVKGSPTLIINGVQSNAGRSPASYLQGICSAFNEAPEECSEQLPSASPSEGFGYKEGTDTVAQC